MHQCELKMRHYRPVQPSSKGEPGAHFRYQGSSNKSRWEAHTTLDSQPLWDRRERNC